MLTSLERGDNQVSYDLCALLRCGYIRLVHVTRSVIDCWFADQVLVVVLSTSFLLVCKGCFAWFLVLIL